MNVTRDCCIKDGVPNNLHTSAILMETVWYKRTNLQPRREVVRCDNIGVGRAAGDNRGRKTRSGKKQQPDECCQSDSGEPRKSIECFHNQPTFLFSAFLDFSTREVISDRCHNVLF